MARTKKFRDITGQRFGKYTVISHIIGQHWVCRCDCGVEKNQFSPNLLSGQVTMCRTCSAKNRIIDLTGRRFGKWTAISLDRPKFWLCRCDCGTESVCSTGNLRSGGSAQCEKCRLVQIHIPKHGHCPGSIPSPTYVVWASIKQRCTNLGTDTSKHYEDRGIKICQGWLSFENFLASMGERPSRWLSIDRTNKDESTRHYSCGSCDECKLNGWVFHCRWATKSEQMLNRPMPKGKLFTYSGRSLSLKEWSLEVGIPQATLYARLKTYNWSFERTITTPRRNY